MSDKPTLMVHSHYGPPKNITNRIFGTDGRYFRSTKPPYSGQEFSLKCAFEEINTFVAVGDWLVFYDPAGRPYSLDYVLTADYSVVNDPANGRIACSCKVMATSWFNLLSRAELYVPMGDLHPTSLVGTIMDIGQWAALNISGAINTAKGSVGIALEAFHKGIARIRFPESLGGEYIGDAIPVVHNEETANLYAQDRIIDEVSVGGGLPNAFNYSFYTSRISEIYNSLFVPESLLIEMYPSLEPVGSGVAPLSKLAQIINARPVLIYTLAPFRAEPLADAVFVYNDFKSVDRIVNASERLVFMDNALAAAGVVPSRKAALTTDTGFTANNNEEEFARLGVEARKNAAVQAYVLTTMFTKKTWDPGKAVEIPERAWRGINLGYNDDKRVNVGTIGLSAEPGSGIEAASKAGLPIINIQSVENHGVRLAKPVWPYTIPGAQLRQPRVNAAGQSLAAQINSVIANTTQPAQANQNGDGTWIAYLRAIAAQVIQFHGNAHKMAAGQLLMDPPDAIVQDPTVVNAPRLPTPGVRRRYVDINCGQAFNLPIRKGVYSMVGYAETIEHSFSINKDTGTISLRANIGYCRGMSRYDNITQFGKVPITGSEQSIAPQATGAVTSQSPQSARQATVADQVIAVGMMLYLPSHLEPGGMEAFARAGGGYFIAKIMNGNAPIRDAATGLVIDEAKRNGLAIEGWGYHYCISAGSAAREGEAAAKEAKARGMGAYYWDAETEWVRSAANTTPEERAYAFRDAFKHEAPDVKLQWTSFSGAEYPLVVPPLLPQMRAAMTTAVLGSFDGYSPQCYGTSSTGLSTVELWNTHVARIVKGTGIGKATSPIFASGRLDADGKTWTPWLGPNGVIAVCRDFHGNYGSLFNRANFFYGSYSRGRLTTGGDSVEPPLSVLIPYLTRAEVPGATP